MNRILYLTSTLVLISFFLFACGQSGRLYLPDTQKPTKAKSQ